MRWAAATSRHVQRPRFAAHCVPVVDCLGRVEESAMLQKLRENKGLQGQLLILPTLLVMLALLVIPLVLTVITSFGQRDPDGNVIYTFTLENYWRLLGFTPEGWDDLYLRILLRSLWLAVQTTVIVILMAYPLAYFIARAAPRRRSLYLFLVLVPLWTNFVIRIYAWVMILRSQGVLNSTLAMIAGLAARAVHAHRLLSFPRRRAGGHGLRVPALHDPAHLHVAGEDRAVALRGGG